MGNGLLKGEDRREATQNLSIAYEKGVKDIQRASQSGERTDCSIENRKIGFRKVPHSRKCQALTRRNAPAPQNTYWLSAVCMWRKGIWYGEKIGEKQQLAGYAGRRC